MEITYTIINTNDKEFPYSIIESKSGFSQMHELGDIIIAKIADKERAEKILSMLKFVEDIKNLTNRK